MAIRVFASLSLRGSLINIKILTPNPIFINTISLCDFVRKVIIVHEPVLGRVLDGQRWIHSGQCLRDAGEAVGPKSGFKGNDDSRKTGRAERGGGCDRVKVRHEMNRNGFKRLAKPGGGGGDGSGRAKFKKPMVKRAKIKWFKLFRWKKKKELESMTAEEKILYKMRLAKLREERHIKALEKIVPKTKSATIHDPEILTPEEHFFFLKRGLKYKNYVPVGLRGVYSGVILNMHLHWKRHQTLQVIVKTFPPAEVKAMATELARLTGAIVLHIHEENTIIMYRGKNYTHPPTEIMQPEEALDRRTAFDRTKTTVALRVLRKRIPKLQQDLECLQAPARIDPESITLSLKEEEEEEEEEEDNVDEKILETVKTSSSISRKKDLDKNNKITHDHRKRARLDSDSEDVSDIFEVKENTLRPLFLEEFDKFPVKSDGKLESFEDHFRRISMETSKKDITSSEDALSKSFDEVDQLFLRSASLFKKSRR